MPPTHLAPGEYTRGEEPGTAKPLAASRLHSIGTPHTFRGPGPGADIEEDARPLFFSPFSCPKSIILTPFPSEILIPLSVHSGD